MRSRSRTRLSTLAIVAAGTLVLAGALPAVAQSTSASPQQSDSKQQTEPTPGSQSDQSMAGSKPGKTGAMSERGGRLGDRELRRHARAHVMLEQKAPDLHAKLAGVKDVMKDLSAEEKQQLTQALKGSGYTLQQYAREHRQIMSSQQLQSRLQQAEQRVKSQSGGAAPSASPEGASGSPSSGAQPGASPQ